MLRRVMKEYVPVNIYIQLIRRVFRFQVALKHENCRYDCNYLLIRFTFNIFKYMAKNMCTIYSLFALVETQSLAFCISPMLKSSRFLPFQLLIFNMRQNKVKYFTA